MFNSGDIKIVQQGKDNFCVVYQRKTGKIIHTHQIISLQGAKKATREEVCEEGRRIAAQKTGLDLKNIEALPIDKDQIRYGFEYKVDVKKKELIEKRVKGWDNLKT